MTTIPITNPDDMHRRLAGLTSPDESSASPGAEPRLAPRFTFELDYRDDHGRRWRGTFTNKILTFELRARMGALRAQMCGGVPVESLDADTFALTRKIAHMTVSLEAKPDWCDFWAMTDDKLLELIYAQVEGHELTFRGSAPAPETRTSRGAERSGEVET